MTTGQGLLDDAKWFDHAYFQLRLEKHKEERGQLTEQKSSLL